MEKRRHEQVRRQKQQDKKLRKAQREAQKEAERKLGKDADLAGMVPGPQPGQIIDFDQ